ncbi:MAG: surface carbohydrate biosynthesis protein [Caldimonas sp.]
MERLAVGYVVDHPKRDLPGAVQFARALLGRNMDAYLVPLYEQALDIPLLPLDAVVVNFARPANFDLVKSYQAMGIPVYVMDTEGGNHTVAGSNTPERLARLLDERGFSKLLAGYFFWGPALRDVFAEHSGMKADKLFTTGCPRFDYASRRWQSVLARPNPGYVLVNSNYPLINPRFSGSQRAEREAMIKAGWEEGYVDRLISGLKAAFTGFTEAIARLATDLPHLQFVYRPHPFEDMNFYGERFSSFSNVRIDASGEALTAITNARCVVHLNCATAIEATMLQRLPIALEYLNTPVLLNHAPLPSQVSKHATSYEHARDMIDNCALAFEGFSLSEGYEKYAYPWFYRNDGGAADRMAEILQQRVDGRRPKRSIGRALRSSRQRATATQLTLGVTANVVGSLALSRLRGMLARARRDKGFDVPQVAAALAALGAVEPMTTPRVERARHPLTGLPLASIRCSAHSRSEDRT